MLTTEVLPFLAVRPVMRLKLSVRRAVDCLGNALAIGIVAVGDAAKAKIIRSTPEIFKGLGLSPRPAFCPQKALLAAGIIHLYFCNNIFAEKHIVESFESAIIFFNVRMDCSTKTSDFKQKEAALTFTLSSS